MPDTYPPSNLAAIDAAHHLHPFADMKKLNAEGTRIIQRGEGVHIFDNHGRKYLDGFAKPLVRQYRLWPPGDHGCGRKADERAALLQHLLRHDLGAKRPCLRKRSPPMP